MAREGISLPSNERLWTPLTKNEMEKIEETAYRMLQEIGFSVEVDEVLEICKKMGCQVDSEKKSATFPKEIVDEYIKKAPKEVFFAGRTHENDVVFEPGKKTFFMAGTAAPRITKWNEEKKEYEYKDATSEDIEYSLKFMEGLEHIDHLLDPPLIDHKITAAGLPDWIHAVQMTLNGCTKHIGRLTCNYFREEWDYYARLAGEVVGGVEELSKRPILASATDGVSPGNIHKKCGWNMLGAAKYGIPSATSMGSVNPVGHPITLAGYLATTWAGHLGHLAITQASRPGLPSILYIPAGSISLKNGYYRQGPEDVLIRVARTQMAHEILGLPAMMGPEIRGHSKVPNDVQTSYEQGLGTILGTLGSSDSILIGFSYECGFSPEADVMAAEAIGYIKQLMRRMNDFEPTEENLAYDAIKKAGPKGSLMTDPHTLKNMKLQYESKFADHRPLNVWLKDRKSMFDRVIEKVKDIERFELPTLPSDMQERMKKIVEEADQKLKRY